jgi:anti-sigma regulatory factor (Ser/Thr protein kinase)
MGDIFAAGGETGRLMRSINWAATPLGPIKDWPQSLCTAVSICLSCPSPLLIWWGPELAMLYNDACRPILGPAKHPHAMAARGADVWPESWDVIGPKLQAVLERGEAAPTEDLVFDRDGYGEKRLFTCSFLPIHGESGEVCGVFTVATETVRPGVLSVDLPDLEHVTVSACYMPPTFVESGGDWYDVMALPDKRTLLAVGDVMGHGAPAAVRMSQLRNALRAYAWQGMGPAGALEQLNRFAAGLGDQYVSTVLCLEFYARNGRLVYASAGHPPPMLLRSDGRVECLNDGRAAPIGMSPDTGYTQAEERLAPGATLLLYTDGLVSSGTRTVDEGLVRLCGAMTNAPADLDAFVDHVLGTVPHEGSGDDVAVLAFRVIDRPVFVLEQHLEARFVGLRKIRRELRAFLNSAGLHEDDVDELVLAISEATANAIEHPLKTTKPYIEVKVEVLHDEVVACVRDFGQWDDTDPEPDRGRGLPLIRALGDVEIRRYVDGTRLIVRRALCGR